RRAALDSGLHAVHALGLRATAAIGDMDSVDADALDAARAYGARLVTLPRDKDETDTHAALALALEWPHRRIVVATGGGGRLDHELGVLAAIFDPRLAGRAPELWRGDTVAYALSGDAVRAVRTRPGDVVGLAAMHGAAGGIDTEGLRWGLADARLAPHESRGASNEALGERVVVRLREGRLLVVHERGLA
ncbi:MAG: thiamine diphosphokinase, partial [Ilumatobacteraceae bacterium]